MVPNYDFSYMSNLISLGPPKKHISYYSLSMLITLANNDLISQRKKFHFYQLCTCPFEPLTVSSISLFAAENVWVFDRATLMENIPIGAKTNINGEGLLIVTAVNRQTGMKQNGTLCKEMFTWNSAKLLCRSIGYIFAEWGTRSKTLLKNTENNSGWV